MRALPGPCSTLILFPRLFFTTFPHPIPAQDALNSAAAAEPPQIRPRNKPGAPASPDDDAKYYYFTIDDSLAYLSFFEDWGPLNLAMVFKACILIHELLEVTSNRRPPTPNSHSQDKELALHRLVLYSSNDPRRKANAALLLALYVVRRIDLPPRTL